MCNCISLRESVDECVTLAIVPQWKCRIRCSFVSTTIHPILYSYYRGVRRGGHFQVNIKNPDSHIIFIRRLILCVTYVL